MSRPADHRGMSFAEDLPMHAAVAERFRPGA
jgi:hypothetical protein